MALLPWQEQPTLSSGRPIEVKTHGGGMNPAVSVCQFSPSPFFEVGEGFNCSCLIGEPVETKLHVGKESSAIRFVQKGKNTRSEYVSE
ncbi:hypothetical protein R1flu_012984 [Riccia fluitans]|uniref:Uncharacterized protein n=1 Tax=Riccia fluitans TaxID=41844 RepID=A0ABD1ZFK4_9MARC